MNWEKEIQLLREYMNVYIQLLPETTACKGKRWPIHQLPTFEYFKETYSDKRYSLVIANYKDSKGYHGSIQHNYTKGLGTTNGIGYRLFNYWMGAKYYIGNNVTGNYNIEVEQINSLLKSN